MKPATRVALGVVIVATSAPLLVRLCRRLRCLWRGRHEPIRQPLGGQRCGDCGAAGADMDDMGFAGSSYVDPGPRRVYQRAAGGGEFTRTSAWEPGPRGW